MKVFIRIIYSIIVFLAANMYSLCIMEGRWYLAGILAVCFVLINIIPSFYNRKRPSSRLRICGNGCELLIIFLISTLLSAIYLSRIAFRMFPDSVLPWFICLAVAVIAEAIVFWNGIIRVYCTSMQLGIKWRLIGIICGWIPLAHLFVLLKIIHIASKETDFESEKIIIQKKREVNQICRTKYPLLLVHGVFFRDFKYSIIGEEYPAN